LAGCATPYNGAPVATNFPSSEQQKLQAAAHWELISQNIANSLISHLSVQTDRYFVESNSTDTPFNRAVENQLITSLVSAGKVVAKYPVNALHVSVDTQVVPFSRDNLKPQFAGAPTLLVSGVWALSALTPATAGAVSGVVVGVDAYDWFSSKYAGDIPKTEIIVTVSVSNAADYLARSTNVYYVSDSDQSLYNSAFSIVKRFSLVGS
jgi:hypothetical protein